MGEDKLLAAQVAKLLFERIVRFFRVPKKFVYDHDPRFTAHFCELWYILGTKIMLPLHFTLRVMGKMSTPIAHSSKFYNFTFITNLYQHS